MRIVSRHENSVKLRAEVPEDLWHLEKIIKEDDLVSGSTYRKFTSDSGKSERKKVFITLKCEKAEFHKGYDKLRVLGIIISGTPEEFVNAGAHHSLDFDVNDVVKIEKIKWQGYEWDRIKEAEKSVRKNKIFALIIDEREAEFFSIREYGVDSVGKITLSGRGKYKEENKDLKSKYFADIYDLIKGAKEKIILAGPGFEKENFLKFLKDKDSKLSKSVFSESISNTGKQGVFELVNKDIISKIVQDSRFSDEVKSVEEVISRLHTDLVTYGLKEVEEALDFGAVEKLIVVDSLVFENKDFEKLLDKAEKTRTKIMMISHENDVSEKLKALGGAAALLRFKVG